MSYIYIFLILNLRLPARDPIIEAVLLDGVVVTACQTGEDFLKSGSD